MRLLALFVAFAINFILLFYKVRILFTYKHIYMTNAFTIDMT